VDRLRQIRRSNQPLPANSLKESVGKQSW